MGGAWVLVFSLWREGSRRDERERREGGRLRRRGGVFTQQVRHDLFDCDISDSRGG